MFGVVWRVLPGPGFVKFLFVLVVVGGLAGFLWFYAFPWADPYLPFNEVTVEADGGGEPGVPGADTDGEGGEDAPDGGEGGGADENIVGVDVPIE